MVYTVNGLNTKQAFANMVPKDHTNNFLVKLIITCIYSKIIVLSTILDGLKKIFVAGKVEL